LLRKQLLPIELYASEPHLRKEPSDWHFLLDECSIHRVPLQLTVDEPFKYQQLIEITEERAKALRSNRI
jgi:hypothetical protein